MLTLQIFNFRNMYARITIDAHQMGGEPCVNGLRIPVATVVTLVAQGIPNDQILSFYPDLTKEDIAECLNFAAEAVREKELPLKIVG